MGQAEMLSAEFRALLPHEWRTWVAENRMLGVDDGRIVDVLVRNVFSEQTAREEIEAAVRHPYFRAGYFLAQRLRKLEAVLQARKQLRQLSSGGIDRRRGLSRQQFLDEYYSRNRPVILEGLLDDWRASWAWTPEYLKEKCGHATVEVMTGSATFAANLLATIDASPVDTIVFDLRDNTGGDASVWNPLLEGIWERLPDCASTDDRRVPVAADISTYTGQSCGLGKRSYAGGRKAVFFFRSKLTLPEGEGPASRSRLWQGTSRGGPSRQPWFSLSHCQKRKTRPTPG